ncbi:hypothetical protein FNV43_RR24164 [Rhamnella rubrinervis]|uniref:Uncharacterized protein n=1 Tax=Rhamnella rubrinervis TaxID=2594499 RepID=A0A8K0GKY4_9ROSA|nr:hypothetical protein FNV43_RR24164 [Rhamnella rubrinervis]
MKWAWRPKAKCLKGRRRVTPRPGGEEGGQEDMEITSGEDEPDEEDALPMNQPASGTRSLNRAIPSRGYEIAERRVGAFPVGRSFPAFSSRVLGRLRIVVAHLELRGEPWHYSTWRLFVGIPPFVPRSSIPSKRSNDLRLSSSFMFGCEAAKVRRRLPLGSRPPFHKPKRMGSPGCTIWGGWLAVLPACDGRYSIMGFIHLRQLHLYSSTLALLHVAKYRCLLGGNSESSDIFRSRFCEPIAVARSAALFTSGNGRVEMFKSCNRLYSNRDHSLASLFVVTIHGSRQWESLYAIGREARPRRAVNSEIEPPLLRFVVRRGNPK